MKNQTKETHVYSAGEFMGNLVEDPTNEEILHAVFKLWDWEITWAPNLGYSLIYAPDVCVHIEPGDEYPDGIVPPEDMPVDEHEEQEICEVKSKRLNMPADKSGAEALREALEADLLKAIKLDPKLEAIVSATSTAT